MKGLLSALAFLVLALGSVSSQAGAHDHRRPLPPILTIGQERQSGKLIQIDWLNRFDEDECDATYGWNEDSFPKPIPIERGSAANIALKKNAPPREWELRVWERVDRQGRPKGEGVLSNAVLLPAGFGAPPNEWTLTFVPDTQMRHLYVRLDVFWADEEGCSDEPDLGSQSGRWTFHLSQRFIEGASKKPKLDIVRAHVVNLAWNGLGHLDPKPASSNEERR